MKPSSRNFARKESEFSQEPDRGADCPDVSDLMDHVLQRTSPWTSRRILEHLPVCPPCAARVELYEAGLREDVARERQ